MIDYQVMPDLTAEEYAELKSDIAARGVMVPIEFDEHGNVLDGHHRLRVCSELGIKEYPKVIRAGMTEAEKRTHARKLNMARRQLNREQKQTLIREQLKETPEKSDRQIAKGLGVLDKTVGVQRKEMVERAEIPHISETTDTLGRKQPRERKSAPKLVPEFRKPVSVFNPTKREERALNNPKVIERMAENNTGVLSAEKQVHREEKAERKVYTPEVKLPDGMCRLFAADIRNGIPEIEDESVDFIITDPPYPKEYVPLYGDLSSLAARVLKPGGSLIVMTGQSYLPEVITELCKSMEYHWCMAYLTPGGQSPQLFHKKVNTFWKPVLWFKKGEYTGEYIGDVLKSPVNNNDKRFHEWGQSIGGMADIVERFTNPGDIILDPFLGGGTTGVTCVPTGRRFIGTDIDEKNVAVSDTRIKEAYESNE